MRDLLIVLENLKIILAALLGVPILFFCLGSARFWIKRRLLQGKLQKFCEKNGFEITWLRHPLESAKTKDCKFDFVLKAKEKVYHVAVLSARHRFREHLFASHDTLQINRAFQMKRTSQSGRRRKPQRRTVDLGVSTTTVPIELNVKVPSDEMKILLFYPVAKEVTCIRGGKKQYLESGEEIYHSFYLFSLSAFFKQVTGEMNYVGKRKIWQYE